MGNTFTRSQRLAQIEARKAFLVEQPDFPVVPSAIEDVSDQGAAVLTDVLERMRAAGLYARTSEVQACRWGIRLLASELRGERVPDRSKWYRG
jgi:hypothetical protein